MPITGYQPTSKALFLVVLWPDPNVVPLFAGVPVERDTPAKLLDDKSSLFSKLVAEYTMRSTHT
jgi:hypothetical protein